MKYALSEKEIDACRPVPFYFITTTDPEELTYEAFLTSLHQLKEEGFGGIVLFNKPQGGFGEEEYLGEAFFDMVRNAAEAVRTLGLRMWINDGYDFPPGAVCGRIRKIAPHLHQRHIRLLDGKPVVETADWGFPAFEEDLSGELFRRLVYEEYRKHVGKYFGDPIIGFFSDTDNRRVLPKAMYDPLSPMRDYFPWSSGFEGEFRAAYGYDIMPFMGAVLRRESIPEARDYWEFAGRLYQKWWKGNSEWLHAHGLLYTGHSSDTSPYLQTEAVRSSCFTEGRFSDAQRHFDFPGTDQELYALDGGRHMTAERMYCPKVVWGEEMQGPKMPAFSDVTADLRAKQAASTAFLYGKKGAMCEMFAAANYGAEPSVLRQIAAYQIMQGITFVVPHAYHHRFRGPIQYFAPPEYGRHSLLSHAMNVLNREIAELTAMISKGEPVYPVALVDPTDDVWMNRYDRTAYFDAFAKLNRLPYGFVICGTRKLLENDYGFQAAVYAGIELPEKTIRALEEKGIRVFAASELGRLKEVVRTDVRYEGEGTPHFLRRRIDGEEFTFFANIESGKPIRGRIRAYGREKEIMLYPGDVRYISAHYDDIPEPEERGENVLRLRGPVPVLFDCPNCVPLECFTSEGRSVLKTDDVRELAFSFTLDGRADDLSLGIPGSVSGLVEKILLNGAECLRSERGKVFDDDYVFWRLSVREGRNSVRLLKNGAFRPFDRILLTGEFDAEVRTNGNDFRKAMQTYNLAVYVPGQAEITLRKRRTELYMGRSQALQGQPFYSGGITYLVHPEAGADGEYRLSFPLVRDTAYLTVNGEDLGKCVKPPYSFRFSLHAGENEIRLTVYNSLANAMECYLEPGGIVSEGVLERL